MADMVVSLICRFPRLAVLVTERLFALMFPLLNMLAMFTLPIVTVPFTDRLPFTLALPEALNSPVLETPVTDKLPTLILLVTLRLLNVPMLLMLG